MGVMPNWLSVGNVLGGIYRFSRKPDARDAILTTVGNLELGLDPVPVIGEQDGWLSAAGAHHMKLWIQFFTNLGHPADDILRWGLVQAGGLATSVKTKTVPIAPVWICPKGYNNLEICVVRTHEQVSMLVFTPPPPMDEVECNRDEPLWLVSTTEPKMPCQSPVGHHNDVYIARLRTMNQSDYDPPDGPGA